MSILHLQYIYQAKKDDPMTIKLTNDEIRVSGNAKDVADLFVNDS